jgi:O-methyltransferase involved in polyketide biosynthesis
MSDDTIASVSDTAKQLVALKSVTNIPFARETSKLIHGHEITEKTLDPAHLNGFYQACAGFEARYLSIGKVLSETDVKNFLELCAGYSFRSLDLGARSGFTYIDTDLPEIIENKKVISAQLVKGQRENEPCLLPLNALDQDAFLQIVSTFPPGPVAIINEGLLIYLDAGEKRQLCRIIHQVLKERGGFWATGDIYIRASHDRNRANQLPDRAKEFLAKHRIFENMFDSFPAAEEFFSECGFATEPHTVDEVYDQLTSLEFIRRTAAIDESTVRAGLEARQTWVLQAV